jgi:1-acyl-sn-glycerol-3-phosphate acyltransferase
MISHSLLQSISIRKDPIAQRLFAKVLALSYTIPTKTNIIVEGWENIPQEPCFLAMNHTDRYNYWPFQYMLSKHQHQYTCTWVKAKYFQNSFVRNFLLACNNIPVASKGGLITSSFLKRMSHKPSGEEYKHIRDFLNQGGTPHPSVETFFGQNPSEVISEIEGVFAHLSKEVVRLNHEALEKGHHILIFPQGTRSKRLSKGHVGLAQMSQRLRTTIVPIGCSGSDLCHPGSNPWAKGGTIIYRIGSPIRIDDPRIAEHHIPEEFIPFSAQANREYRSSFQSITNTVMDEINTLVDPPYQYSLDKESDGVQGVERFI